MKFAATTTLAFLAAAMTAVSGQPMAETNAQRMKRGLAPNPPARRAPTVVAGARRGTPSSNPSNQCNTGPVQCCQTLGHANNGAIGLLLGLLGVVVKDLTVLIGATCSPISAVGIGGNSCSTQPVCCTNNSFNGIIAIGCSPININL